eukprot:6526986-Alexandrium_andersonii.AAC.1
MVAHGPPDRGGRNMAKDGDLWAALCEILQHKGEHNFKVSMFSGSQGTHVLLRLKAGPSPGHTTRATARLVLSL